jgi:hypothetical protein
VLADNAAGDYATDTIYDDASTVQIETLADTQPHRNVDLELINADKEGVWQFSYIPIPSLYICKVMSGFTLSYPLRSMGSLPVN